MYIGGQQSENAQQPAISNVNIGKSSSSCTAHHQLEYPGNVLVVTLAPPACSVVINDIAGLSASGPFESVISGELSSGNQACRTYHR